MFWIGYLGFFFYSFYQNQGLNPAIPRSRIIYSILGLDTYFQAFGQLNFSMVGRMVPGIYYYFLFVLSTASEMAADASFESGTCRSRFICRFSCAEQQIQFGTAAGFTSKDLVWDVFYAKRKEVKWPTALISLGVIIVNSFLPWKIDSTLQATYIGIAVFLILVWAADYLKWIPFRRICAWICKYSYAIFIVHHSIIFYMAGRFDLYEITRFNSYLLFLCCCGVIFPAAYVLKKVNDRVVDIFRVDKKKKLKERGKG